MRSAALKKKEIEEPIMDAPYLPGHSVKVQEKPRVVRQGNPTRLFNVFIDQRPHCSMAWIDAPLREVILCMTHGEVPGADCRVVIRKHISLTESK
jgi:hypothetical protein